MTREFFFVLVLVLLTHIFVVRTLFVSASHIGSVLLKVIAHQFVEPLMPGRMLYESSLITKTVKTIVATAVEM